MQFVQAVGFSRFALICLHDDISSIGADGFPVRAKSMAANHAGARLDQVSPVHWEERAFPVSRKGAVGPESEFMYFGYVLTHEFRQGTAFRALSSLAVA